MSDPSVPSSSEPQWSPVTSQASQSFLLTTGLANTAELMVEQPAQGPEAGKEIYGDVRIRSKAASSANELFSQSNPFSLCLRSAVSLPAPMEK